jgi:hypothetical protein
VAGSELSYTALTAREDSLKDEENDARVVVLPGAQNAKAAERPKWALHGLLFIATLATTTWAGALHAGVNLLQQPERFAVGLPYSLGLLFILGSRGAHGISLVAMASLFLLALFVWPGLMFWALIVFFIAGTRDAPAANDLTPVGPPRKALRHFTFLLLLLIIVPVPYSLYEAISVYWRHL